MKNVIEISAHRRLRNQPQNPQDIMYQPSQSISVLRSDALRVIDGANLGDTLSFADDLTHDDVYELATDAALVRLSIHVGDQGRCFRIADDTRTGQAGRSLHLDSVIILMTPDGGTTEVIIMVEVDSSGNAAEIYALPLAPLMVKTNYTLVGIDTVNTLEKFGQTACVSFARGTHITMSSGAQCLIESLKVGDRVLTRDDGVQTIRWIGQNTVRAVGEYAPIVLAKGTLNNTADLVLRPDHRLFIYQRSDAVGVGRAEVLVKARHLLNGSTVVQREGGFIDYFQLLFDDHQIIYAEGIAAETVLIDMRTRSALPEELTDKLALGGNGDRHASSGQMHRDFEISKSQLNDHPNAVEMLRLASQR